MNWWWKKYGYTLAEIGKHMGISRERVRQLAVKDSQRVKFAVQDMEMAARLADRALRETGIDVRKKAKA